MTRRRIGLALVLSIGASIGLMVTYLTGGNPRWEGALLGVALGTIGWAMIVAAHEIFDERVSEEHEELASAPPDRDAVSETMRRPVSRRALLVWFFVAAFSALAGALGFPIDSIAGSSSRDLFDTAWSRGIRLVDGSGEPIRVDTLAAGGAITAFPEGDRQASDSIVMLIRADPAALDNA